MQLIEYVYFVSLRLFCGTIVIENFLLNSFVIISVLEVNCMQMQLIDDWLQVVFDKKKIDLEVKDETPDAEGVKASY